jgi:hypothetical protein
MLLLFLRQKKWVAAQTFAAMMGLQGANLVTRREFSTDLEPRTNTLMADLLPVMGQNNWQA